MICNVLPQIHETFHPDKNLNNLIFLKWYELGLLATSAACLCSLKHRSSLQISRGGSEISQSLTGKHKKFEFEKYLSSEGC